MFEMIPFREDDSNIKYDFFSPFPKNFFNDDSLTEMSNVHKNFNVDLKETDENYLKEADLPRTKKD